MRVEPERSKSIGRSKNELFSRLRVNEKNPSPFKLRDINADIKMLEQHVCHKFDCDVKCTIAKVENPPFQKFRERIARGIEEG